MHEIKSKDSHIGRGIMNIFQCSPGFCSCVFWLDPCPMGFFRFRSIIDFADALHCSIYQQAAERNCPGASTRDPTTEGRCALKKTVGKGIIYYGRMRKYEARARMKWQATWKVIVSQEGERGKTFKYQTTHPETCWCDSCVFRSYKESDRMLQGQKELNAGVIRSTPILSLSAPKTKHETIVIKFPTGASVSERICWHSMSGVKTTLSWGFALSSRLSICRQHQRVHHKNQQRPR